ncbi:formate dehydrogenase accessory sulfurtransferase FdhD [Breoghania sp. L-A4]|nr:formate dehydrogenase accessory sulfurtransferase FdhD [Breoghania sp. L-A4]
MAEDITPHTSSTRRIRTVSWNRPAPPSGLRAVPEETAVALTYNGSTHAVMMATPCDLEDYAYGFSLTEGQIQAPSQIRSIDVIVLNEGIDVRIWLDADTAAQLRDRRRRIAGPTGCGLCGIESLSEAVPRPARVQGDARVTAADIMAAQRAMVAGQTLHAETSAVHAAALWTPSGGLLAIREDVGRHNALDKLVGALSRAGPRAHGGMLLLTSRVSVEMVQKAAVLGSPVLVAVSAPTALAVRTAEAAGITIVAMARDDGFEVFSHPHRIVPE